MKCPNCNREIEDWRGECPHCKSKADSMGDVERTNADCLNIVANINLAIFIIASLYYWYNVLTGIYEIVNYGFDEINIFIINLICGLSLILVGFTIFFLLKTIIDIYYKVNKK